MHDQNTFEFTETCDRDVKQGKMMEETNQKGLASETLHGDNSTESIQLKQIRELRKEGINWRREGGSKISFTGADSDNEWRKTVAEERPDDGGIIGSELGDFASRSSNFP